MFKTNKIAIFLSVLIIIVIGYFLLKKDNVAIEPIVKEEATKDWVVFSDSELSFKYPEKLGTTYITEVNWPPSIIVKLGSFACDGNKVQLIDKTEIRVVGDRTYCITEVTEGAAGSVYTDYTYKINLGEKVVIFNFNLRATQCANYDDPNKTQCEEERATFDIDKLVDQMFGTLSILE